MKTPALIYAVTSALSLHSLAAATVETLLQEAERNIQQEAFAQAETLLNQALKLKPANTDVLYRVAYVQYRQRKLPEARRNFAAVVKHAPPAYYSRYFLGRISLLENNPREAITWLEPIMRANQAIYDTPAQLAAAYAGAGMRKQSIAALGTAIADAPWDAALYYRLGQLYSQEGQTQLAQDAFENSRRLRNTSREDVQLLMKVAQLIGEGKNSEAVRAAGELQIRPDANPNALVALGVLYGKGAMQSEALHAFERAADRDPKLFQAQFNRGLALLKSNRGPEALSPLAKAVEILPVSPDANTTYGLALVMNQRYGEAVGPLERVWSADNTNPRVGALLATAYLRSGAAAKAVAVLQNGIFRDAQDPAVHLLLAEALNAAEDTAGALTAAEAARRRFPNVPQTHMAVARQLARLGRYQDARPAFLETLRLAPGHPEAELGLADTFQKSGEHSTAMDHYRTALRSSVTALAARLGLARSMIALRQFEDARKVLEDGAAAHPADVAIRIELARVYARLGRSDLASEQTRVIEQLRSANPNP